MTVTKKTAVTVTFKVAGDLRPLVPDLAVHQKQNLVLLLTPRSTVEPVLQVVRVPLPALLVRPTPHQFGHLPARSKREGSKPRKTKTVNFVPEKSRQRILQIAVAVCGLGRKK